MTPEALQGDMSFVYYVVGGLIAAISALYLQQVKYFNDQMSQTKDMHKEELTMQEKHHAEQLDRADRREEFLRVQLLSQIESSKRYMDMMVESMKRFADNTEVIARKVEGCPGRKEISA
jgi:Na+/phosphate symporter